MNIEISIVSSRDIIWSIVLLSYRFPFIYIYLNVNNVSSGSCVNTDYSIPRFNEHTSRQITQYIRYNVARRITLLQQLLQKREILMQDWNNLSNREERRMEVD